MSLKIDRVQLDIVINNDQARVQLRKLEEEARQLTREMGKLDKTSQEYADKSKKLVGIKTQMDSIYQSIGVTNLSMRELTNRQKELNAILLHLRPGTIEYKNLKEEVDAVGNRIAELKGKAKDTDFSIGKIADGFNRYFAFVTAGLASLTGLIFSLRKVVDVANLFESRVDNLSALTGLLGKDLDWLSEKAKTLSTSVIEGNVRIKSSATEIVDAYTKVGSKRPELLKVKEDLNDVTQEALILAAAANGDLAPAVDGLTMVLNQFNAPASDSRRIINVLAAGSKEGAGEIDYLTAGFEKAGSVASSFNISVEELTGVLETLAPRMTEPEMAGRSLRNIMIKLETQSNDNLKPSLVGLGKAFEELHRQQWTVAQLTDLVGTENINAANILMNNTAETKKYTEAVTGTNVALEQAAINTDNNATKLQQAKNRVEVLSIAFGQKLAPAMTFSTNIFAAFMRVMMAAPGFVHQYSTALITLAGLTLAYNASLVKSISLKVWNHLLLKEGIGLKIKDAIVIQALIVKEQLLTIWKGNGTVATKLATTAQWAWNAALAANPIGLIIAGLTALVVGIKLYSENNAEALRMEQERINAVRHLTSTYGLLKKQYDDLTPSIEKLNTLNLEQKLSTENLTIALLNQAEAELALAKTRQAIIQRDNSKTTWWQNLWNSALSGNNMKELARRQKEDAIANGKEAGAVMDEYLNKLQDQVNLYRERAASLNEILHAEELADEITGKSISQLEEKQRYLTTALKNYEKGSADYIRIAKKLGEVTKQLQSDASGSGGAAKAAADAIQELNKTISDLDSKINDAVVSGNLPLAEKLTKEKLAAEKLLETYKAVKLEIEKGWDVDQRDLGSIEKLTSIGQKLAKPKQKETAAKSPLQKRNTGIEPATPEEAAQAERDRVVKEEADAADKKKAIQDATFASAASISNGIFEITKNRQQAELDHKLSMLEKERDAELSNKNLTEAQKDAINDKYDAKSRKLKQDAFKKQQNSDKIQAIINGALAITKTFAAYGFTPAGWAAAAAQGVATAMEFAVITSQKMPEFSKGRYDVTGISGTEYKNIPYAGNAQTGIYTHPAIVGETGAEIIIDPKTTRNIVMNYPGILDAIQYARMPEYAGGRFWKKRQERVEERRDKRQERRTGISADTMEKLADAMDIISKEGVRGKWVLSDLEKIRKDKGRIEDATAF